MSFKSNVIAGFLLYWVYQMYKARRKLVPRLTGIAFLTSSEMRTNPGFIKMLGFLHAGQYTLTRSHRLIRLIGTSKTVPVVKLKVKEIQYEKNDTALVAAFLSPGFFIPGRYGCSPSATAFQRMPWSITCMDW